MQHGFARGRIQAGDISAPSIEAISKRLPVVQYAAGTWTQNVF